MILHASRHFQQVLRCLKTLHEVAEKAFLLASRCLRHLWQVLRCLKTLREVAEKAFLLASCRLHHLRQVLRCLKTLREVAEKAFLLASHCLRHLRQVLRCLKTPREVAEKAFLLASRRLGQILGCLNRLCEAIEKASGWPSPEAEHGRWVIENVAHILRPSQRAVLNVRSKYMGLDNVMGVEVGRAGLNSQFGGIDGYGEACGDWGTLQYAGTTAA